MSDINKEAIYEQLREQIPYLLRHECTPRVMAATDALLDSLLEIKFTDGLQSLLKPEPIPDLWRLYE